ncbi:MAG TPA: MerR family transcriptional regulator [Candidatus Omnitrophota bacterium]|nr:MerR family transcriptional regulator [Candidatus Omnitrophota bacterium]HPD84165.1 MerR family transcriptional regulator [Candidatus Omnitrophota bacterium]HRZ03022.1 MerR family transcriptional regulator [Candidatus Omnitrophota bacterium]
MRKESAEKFDVFIKPEDPVYVIGVVSQIVNIPIWTLRKLDEMGVVQPIRIGKKTRCYSKIQIQKLSYVHYLMEDKHVNISGIKVILEIGGGVEKKEDGL